MSSPNVEAPVVKVGSAWAAVLAGYGITTWGDVAALLAALYTALLMGEWVWKKWIRPFLEHMGLLTRLKRRKDDE